jgi:hydroxymethylbilane synthase
VTLNRTLILGTRGSRLALWQANHVRDRLMALIPGVQIELRTIKTIGDRVTDRPLSQVGGTGLFVKEIEEALKRCEIDFAVHSMKDLPTAQPEGLTIAAVTEREDPYDTLVTADGTPLAGLKPGARVGTSSPRRVAQLRHQRPDLVPAELRGNVDTRVRKLLAGEYDAIVLAEAGLKRLGIEGVKPVRIGPDVMLPCAGQGALAIETRTDDHDCRAIIARLEDAVARMEVDAERALLAGLGGGCSAPIGTLARVADGRISVAGAVGDPEGKNLVRAEATGKREDGVLMAQDLARQLREEGADDLLRLVKKA